MRGEIFRPQVKFPIVLIPIEMTQFDQTAKFSKQSKCDRTLRLNLSREVFL